ncbi:MAG: VWA domain-containing protein [Verrucomicrobiaceae bacterium]|nr:VWA domain-containing protein [Verrucomicrobiaceae bacterium]
MKALLTHSLIIALSSTMASAKAGKHPGGKPIDTRPSVEVCFVLDTTGSMGGLIAGAKEKIWSIANDLTDADPAPLLKIGLIAYRDRGDDYITKNFALTDDLDSVYENLMGFQAAGGGDGPESVNQALDDAVNKIKWSPGRETLKIIFLVGDCPPHMDYKDDIKYPDTCKVAVRKGIIINTVQCGNNSPTTSVWKEIAHLSEGSFAAIEQGGGMAAIATPIDARIADLTREINTTVIAFGDEEKQSIARQKLSIASGSGSSVAATAARQAYFSKNLKGKAISGHEDLVSEVTEGNVTLDEVKPESLPEQYRKLNKSELAAAIKEQQDKREKLQSRMNKLVHERNAWLKKAMEKRKADNKDNGFDAKIRRAVKEQGKKKGIQYKS